MISKKELEKHVEFLKKDVFFVKNKWPHFELLFKDLNFYSKEYINKNVLFLERTGLYGDISLFAPLFCSLLLGLFQKSKARYKLINFKN